MKKWCILAVAVFLISAQTAYGAKVSHRQGAAKSPAKAHASKIKDDPYKSFCVAEATTGVMLDGENVHAKRAPASVTKLMLALVVMDKLAKGEVKLTDKVTVSLEASKMGGSQVYLEVGETFTLEEMMKAVMVASANDAAYAVAEHVGGSKEGFVNLMNEQAKALGMKDTEFQSPHGLPPSKGEKEDLTTAQDLIMLAREALKHPKILEWTAMKSEPFRNGTFIMNNHNKLLTKMTAIDGLKTGFYSETGFNVVATAKRGDLRFIAVVMGSPSAKIRDDVTMEKLKKAFGQLRMLSIVKKGELVDKEVMLVDGKYRKLKGVAAVNFLYPVPSEKKGSVKKDIALPEKIKGEIKEGQKMGEILIQYDNQQVGKVDIVSPVHVPTANLFTRFIRRLGLNI
ncbi:MAG TPA: D-alanyl-D-alanine carboxypeptidase family protein [Syntrophorhabdaceae bacterium]|jgi:D-alanyl-D-alanine carboxypeptidase (penicillin-binding protein 5/6)